MALSIKKNKATILQCKGMADGIVHFYRCIELGKDLLNLTEDQLKMLMLIADKSLIDLHLHAMVIAEDEKDEEMARKIKIISELNTEKESTENAE